MRNIVVLIITVFVTSCAAAQIVVSPVLGMSNTRYIPGLDGFFPNWRKRDLRLGVLGDLGLGQLSFQSGIFYTTNSQRYTEVSPAVGFSIHSLELPLNIAYTFGKGQRLVFFVVVGPYGSLNIGGWNRLFPQHTPNVPSVWTDDKITFGSDSTAEFRRFAAGCRIEVGWQFRSGIAFRIYYQRMLTNLMPQRTFFYTGDLSTISYGISLAYRIQLRRQQPVEEKSRQ